MAKSENQHLMTVDGLTVEVFTGDHKLTVETVKERLGWITEAEVAKAGVKFEGDYLLRDHEGNKVRCTKNDTNRPFGRGLADEYALEFLRNTWEGLNGETFIFDSKGMLHNGQHRLIGLVLAEQLRQKNKEKWKEYGVNGPIKIDAIFVTGISHKREVVDSIDGGRKRSVGDVFFRHEFDKGFTAKQRKTLNNMLAGAVRLSWLRQGGKVVSDAPKLPRSEAIRHLEANPGIRAAVEYVWREDEGVEGSGGGQIGSLISLPYAAALLYLMSGAKSTETKQDFTLLDKAQEFWTKFASGAGLEANDPILVLRKLLQSSEASSAAGRDGITIMVVKAWNAWIDGNKVTAADIKVKMKTVDGVKRIDEDPRIGGLDIVREKPKVELPEIVEKPVAKGAVAKPVPAPKAKAGKAAPKPKKKTGAAAIKTVEGDPNQVVSFE